MAGRSGALSITSGSSRILNIAEGLATTRELALSVRLPREAKPIFWISLGPFLHPGTLRSTRSAR